MRPAVHVGPWCEAVGAQPCRRAIRLGGRSGDTDEVIFLCQR